MKSTMRFAALATSVLLALAGVACSSDDDDNNTGGTGGSGGQTQNDGGTDTDSGTETDSGSETDGEAPNVCDPSNADTECGTCGLESCCDAYTACVENEACAAALDAFGDCVDANGLDACAADFVTNAGDDGSDAANDLVTCMNTNCADKCAAEGEGEGDEE